MKAFIHKLCGYSFLLECICNALISQNKFVFLGWQDYSALQGDNLLYFFGKSVRSSLYCASKCLEIPNCHSYHFCRLNGERYCFIKQSYGENTTQDASMSCKSYNYVHTCNKNETYNRVTDSCECSVSCTQVNTDCQSVGGPAGVYTLSLNGTLLQVRCDMDTDGGGWIVIQRRIDGSEDFYRTWQDYKQGFGVATAEYWIGLETMHLITSSASYTLRIDMEYQTKTYHVSYSEFRIASEADKYRMTYTTFLGGSTGDALSWHKGKPFTTRDRDNDNNVASYDDPNCAIAFYGAWWYNSCHNSNLNGHYGDTRFGKGINWNRITSYYNSLSKVEMKIRKQ